MLVISTLMFNPAIFKILLLVMNSNVCILYMSIFCIPSIYDGIHSHKITSVFFPAHEHSISCASWGLLLTPHVKYTVAPEEVPQWGMRISVEWASAVIINLPQALRNFLTTQEMLLAPVQQVALRCRAGTIPGGVQSLSRQKTWTAWSGVPAGSAWAGGWAQHTEVPCCLICPVSQWTEW